MKAKYLKHFVAAFSIAAVAACNLDDNNASGGAGSTTVGGVAATGAPIVGGLVKLSCSNGVTASANTAADGKWSTTVPANALPCNVKVSGGTPAGTFYSVAQRPSGTATTSTANVTPLTNLATAAAINSAGGRQALEAWFASDSLALRQQVADGMALAVAQLRTALNDAGYELPASDFDPFTAAITAGGANDLYDQILEAYKAALAAAGKTYEDANDDYVAGSGLPDAEGGSNPAEPPDTSLTANETGVRFATTGTVLGAAEDMKLRYWSGAGTVNVGSAAGLLNEVTFNGSEANSYVNLRNIPDAPGTYDCGYGVNEQKANVEIGFAVSNG
jgi:hypothetical protein